MTCATYPEAKDRLTELQAESVRLEMNEYVRLYIKRVWLNWATPAYRIFVVSKSGENGKSE
jgi:hypothetical protein